MKEFPPELIYILIFGAILLFQYIMRRGGTRGPREPQGPPEPQELEELEDSREPSRDALVQETSEELIWGLRELEKAGRAASLASRESAEQRRRRESSTASPAHPQRRFSRQSLMGTKRDVQNAIVIANILGRCRAFEPHETP